MLCHYTPRLNVKKGFLLHNQTKTMCEVRKSLHSSSQWFSNFQSKHHVTCHIATGTNNFHFLAKHTASWGPMSVNVVDSKQPHTKCSGPFKKICCIHLLGRRESCTRKVRSRCTATEGKHNNKTRLCASISKMTKGHMLVKVTNDKTGDKKGYQEI